jgi:hypothetical protein
MNAIKHYLMEMGVSAEQAASLIENGVGFAGAIKTE